MKDIRRTLDKSDSLIEVRSVEAYLYVIDLIYYYMNKKIINENSDYPDYRTRLWFRGVKSDKYDLIPTICRNNLNVNYETIYLSKFKSKAIPFLDEIPCFTGTPSYWGWLFLMQHYGVPTRLMDWSKDPLAVIVNEKSSEYENTPVVWCLSPIKLNEVFDFHKVYKKGYIPNVEEKIVYDIFGPNEENENIKPCAVYGPMNNMRIIAQKGVFTVVPYNVNLVAMNKLSDASEYLFRIAIDKRYRDIIVKQLKNYGITLNALYPQLDSIAKQIEEEEELIKK
jgi:FRG domain-containing protein